MNTVVDLQNTIIAGNSLSDVAGVTLNSLGGNIVGDGTGTGYIGSDQIGVDPMLGAIADNGGPTMSHGLLVGSPGIDQGTDTGGGLDQRGFLRDDTPDVGAVEFGATDQSPEGIFPLTQITVQDTALTFEAANSNQITVSDNALEQLEVSMSVDNGTLGLGSIPGGFAVVGSEIIVNSSAGAIDEKPAIAMAGDGSYVVVNSKTDGAGSGEIYLQRFAVDGSKIGAVVLVNTTTLGYQKDPSIGIASDGSFVVVWNSDGQDGGQGGVYGQRFNSDGTKAGIEFAVNTVSTGEQLLPDVAVNGDGAFIVTWQSPGQDGDGESIVAQRFAADGTMLGGEIVVNSDAAVADQTASKIAIDDSGNFVVVWNDTASNSGDVVARRFDATGAAQGSSFRVNQNFSSPTKRPRYIVHKYWRIRCDVGWFGIS